MAKCETDGPRQINYELEMDDHMIACEYLEEVGIGFVESLEDFKCLIEQVIGENGELSTMPREAAHQRMGARPA